MAEIIGTHFSGAVICEKVIERSPSKPNIIYGETPTGEIDGVNKVYFLANAPLAGTARLHINGLRCLPISDYSISGAQITMCAAPIKNDIITVDYNF